MSKEELKIFNYLVAKANSRARIYVSLKELEILKKIKEKINKEVV